MKSDELDGRADPILNAMTVDVEDYYQVSAFAGCVAREGWSKYPARVEQNTYRILDLFESHQLLATFFVLGCIAKEHPSLVRAIVDRGHELGSHGYAHYRVDAQDASTFRRDVLATKSFANGLKGHRGALGIPY